MPTTLGSQLLTAFLHDMPQRGSPTTAATRWIRALIVLTLAIAGFVVGSATYSNHQTTAGFYQDSFGVAVSIACTGHIDAVVGNPHVDAFLADPTAVLESCDGVDAARSPGWNALSSSTLYLYVLTALTWVLFGFSWSSLSAIAGLFAAGFTVGAYLFVRCFTSSRIVAAGLALAVLFAPPALQQIPHLRDFSKAPLILLGLGLIGRAVLSAVSLRGAISLAGCVGLLIGLGKGLRPDAVLLVPVAVVTFVLLWRGGEGWKIRIRQIFFALLALFVAYVIASAPVAIVTAMKNANPEDQGAHVFILGFAETFQDALGFERGNYALIRDYQDSQAEALVNLYHSGVGPAPISYGRPSYELLTAMFAATPHDALMRVFATANALGAYPIDNLVYGPVLVLLLAAGFILLPRRAVFYCICGSVIVPILSLQFGSRHAFYVVVFGAAALGLAYTVAAMAITAVLDRKAGDWPSRPQILRRIVLLGGSVATIVAVVCASDYVARGRQERALVALHEIYRNANWSQIEMVYDDAGVRFPTLTSAPEVGVMALSFAFADPDPTVGVISDLDWLAVGTAKMVPLDAGFRMTSNGKSGYQFMSRHVYVAELSDPSEGSEFRTLSVRIRGKALSDGWSFGALSHDDTRGIGAAKLSAGRFDRRVTLQIPRTEPSVHLIWAAEPGASSVEIDQFVASNAFALQGCIPTPWNIAPLHSVANGSPAGAPTQIPAAKSGTYYFPFEQLRGWSFESVKIDGAPARCVTGARIALTLPTNTLPLELIEIDGEFHPTQRLNWGALLADFARWHRKARYL